MSQYKFGVTQWGLPGDGIYAVKLTKEAGLDGLQIELGSYERGFPLSQKRIQDSYLEDAEKYGVEFPSLVLNDLCVNGFVNGRNTKEGEIAYHQMMLAIKTAKYMNIGIVMLPMFFANYIKEEKHFINAAEAIKFCCEEAAQYGITVASEGCISWEEHLRLINMVDMPNHKIYFDSQNYNFLSGLNQVEQLENMYEHLVDQIHLKDGIDHLSGSLVGSGDSSIFEQLEFIVKKNFTGWLIFENLYDQLPLRSENEGDQLSILMDDLYNVKKALKQVE